MGTHYLEVFYRFVCGFPYSCPGVLILLSIHYSVIADLVPAEDRSIFLSRLDACVTAAFILGPAIGGILGQVNNHFPLYVAGVASGIAMIIAMIFLKESNPIVLQRRNAKKNSSAETVAAEVKETAAVEVKETAAVEVKETAAEVKETKEEKPLKKEKLKVTGTMCLCFCFEFCLRWTVNAFDSRYGIYLTDIYDTPSIVFS